MTSEPVPTAARVVWPWHPVVFATVIVVTPWLDAAVSPYAATRPLLVAVVIAMLLTAVASLVLKSLQLGAIVASGVLGLLWSKPLISQVPGLGSGMGPLVIASAVLIVVVGVFAFRAMRRLAPRITRQPVTTFLNRAALLLLLASVALGLVRGSLGAVADDLDQGMPLAAWAGSASGELADPDLYVILLDGYPRADVLEYAFDLDNTPFIDALEERGFDVADASHSDYLWTHVSVPSALNLDYVEQIPAMLDVIEGRAPRQPTLRTTVADNAAFGVAREHDYSAVAVGSGFEEVAPRRADVYVDGGQLNEFEISLLVATYVGDLVTMLAPDFASSQQRDRILFNLDVLADVAAMRDRPPALVFAHVPSPHQPVVFGSDGAPVSVPLSESFYWDSPLQTGQDPEEFREQYRAQLPYLNDRIIAAIDGIIANAVQPPVIVLFADHGSASVTDWNATTTEDADPARVLERTGALLATLTPERGTVFADDTSPVDIFRQLFDAYLGTEYGRATPPEGGGQIPPVDASVLDE